LTLVLDASVTLAWVLDDASATEVPAIIRQVVVSGAFVPSLWRLEVANVLTTLVRRNRLSVADRDASIADLLRWPIEIDTATDQQAWSATLRMTDRHRLTVYDAAYLELAARRRLPLATLDGDLMRAAAAEGVPVRA
jgi:predicted nucleic acid-binding protein